MVEGAFVLDGAGDFIEVPHDPALNVGTGDFTVDLWVNFNTTEGEQVLIEKYIEDFSFTPSGWFLTKLDGNSLRFGTGPAFSDHGVDSPPLSSPTNAWIHFAVRRSSSVASIFMNGTLVTAWTFVDNTDSTSSLKFGHRGNPIDTPGSQDTREFFLNGRIDEVELFVWRSLDDTEIMAIFNAGNAGKCKETTTVQIAIHPGSFPNANSINPQSKGVIPVAILLTNTFDPTAVDPNSVKFWPANAEEAHGRGHNEDINGDGKTDLVLHFRTQDTGIVCGNTSVSLTATTFSGEAIKGSTSIRTVGCN